MTPILRGSASTYARHYDSPPWSEALCTARTILAVSAFPEGTMENPA